MRSLRASIAILLLSGGLLSAGENLLQNGDFAQSKPGGPPMPGWTLGKEAQGINTAVDKPSQPFGQGKNWVYVSDQTEEGAAFLIQELPKPVTAGRLSFTLHIVDHAAAIWFILGRNQVSKSDDLGLGLKISSAGGLIVSAKGDRVTDISGAKKRFAKGETYQLYCDFGPRDAEGKTPIKMGQVGGEEFFNGTAELSEEYTALAIRTHKEQGGSEFYLTDIVLTESP